MDGIADFFSPAAGQRRRAWLDGVDGKINEALRYYLGAGGMDQRVGAAANLAQMFSPGTDVMDATTASGNLMGARSPMEAATAGAAMVGALGSMFIPGNAQRAGEALTRFGADEFGGMKLFRGDTGSNERIRGGIGEGLLFGTPHEDVARLYGDDITSFELPDGAKILTEGSKDFAAVTGRRRGPLLRNLRAGENLTAAANEAIERARAAGYDAVEFNSMRDMGVAVINPNIVRPK